VNRTDVTQLTDLFQRLGARDPQGWARSQIAEGLPNLSAFCSSAGPGPSSFRTVTAPGLRPS
jgi:hypothetical protein